MLLLAVCDSSDFRKQPAWGNGGHCMARYACRRSEIFTEFAKKLFLNMALCLAPPIVLGEAGNRQTGHCLTNTWPRGKKHFSHDMEILTALRLLPGVELSHHHPIACLAFCPGIPCPPEQTPSLLLPPSPISLWEFAVLNSSLGLIFWYWTSRSALLL